MRIPTLAAALVSVTAFQSSSHEPRRLSTQLTAASKKSDSFISRQSFLATTIGAACATALTPTPSFAEEATVFQLPSGLKYLELKPGSGASPRYGQLCSIAYKAYIKLPSSKDNPNPSPQQFETCNGYLLKHGNGRTISGLDEGLHTMQVGGTRRLLIPPKLGFVDIGLGPVPEYPWDRQKLNGLLNDMVKYSGGTLIYEVTLLSVLDDEADQGYYEDASLTPEDFDTLRRNLQRKGAAARAATPST